ncbi:MAG: methanogenesis marker protein Mmp4/MtxX [Halobacteriota archaeon]|nr:methanogenesis marker protein Mmp4/MtxX [Halobacteriota archaeon]
MNLQRKIDTITKGSIVRVGIGVDYPHENVIFYAIDAEDFADIVLVGDEEKISSTGTDIEIIDTKSPEKELISLLVEGEIDAAVRGNLRASETLNQLKTQTNLEKIYRMALLQTTSKDTFFLSPVGIDEGKSAEEKIEIIRLGSELLKRFDLEAKVGVLSGGRFGDVGRSEVVDRSLEEAELIVQKVTGMGICAKHHQILIEDAVKESNIIIAPDGISGNLIFRTLVLLGGGMGFGAPILMDKVFIDTSRASDSYGRAIKLASMLALKL